MSSAQNLEDPKKDAINNKLSKRMIFSYFATFALGMVASQALLQTSSNQEMNESKFLQKLWMSNQFQNFTWNTTRDIDYNQTGDGFSDIFVSPTGEIFGVQTVIIPEQRVSRAFRYNPNWDMWNDVFYNFNTKKIRFDSEGNFYLIDQNNTLYAKNSQDEVLLPCVQDVAPSSNGTVFVIQYENYDCQYNQSQYNFSNSSNTTDIQVYSASYYKKIVIFYGQPVFITVNNTLEKFFFYFQKDSHCLSDISVASDGTLWGINCTYFNSNMVQTGSLTKWNNQTANFDDVYNITAQRVEAYNEISVALLKDGRISYSLLEGSTNNHTYLAQPNIRNNFEEEFSQ
eukprot:403350205